MKVMKLQAAAAGMVLAKDVITENGQMLLAKGATLSNAVINSLIHKGLTSIYVIESDAASQKEYSEEELAAVKEECRQTLLKRFYRPPATGMMQALFDAILEEMVVRKTS